MSKDGGVNTLRTRSLVCCVSALVFGAVIVGCSDPDASREQPIVTAPPIPPSTTSTVAPVTVATTVAAVTTPPTVAIETTTTAEATTTTVPAGAALTLREDGIGTTFFGADPDAVVAYVQSILGAPTQDSGWVTAFDSPFGVCPGSEVRGVSWFDLTLLFSDATDLQDASPHFFHYQYGGNGVDTQPAGIVTDKGLAIGDTVVRLREVYPLVQVFDDELFGSTFVVSGGGLTGYLTSSADDGTINIVSGGQSCGE
jgi:hypothetical protein